VIFLRLLEKANFTLLHFAGVCGVVSLGQLFSIFCWTVVVVCVISEGF
jgi:hypothetical protein